MKSDVFWSENEIRGKGKRSTVGCSISALQGPSLQMTEWIPAWTTVKWNKFLFCVANLCSPVINIVLSCLFVCFHKAESSGILWLHKSQLFDMLSFCSDLLYVEKIFEKMNINSLEHRRQMNKLMSSVTPKSIIGAWRGKAEQAMIIF